MYLAGFITKRYLKSKKESRFISIITSITILGITLGVAVVIMALTILDGFQKIVSEKIVEFNSHIKVISFGNRNLPDQNKVIPEIKKQFGYEFVSIQPFVSKLAITKSRHLTEGVTLIGIDPKISNLFANNIIKQGVFDLNDSDSTFRILLGEKLAEKMFVKVGDKITVFGLRNDQVPSIDNPPSIVQFRVAGIYESGLSEYDDLNAFINISTAQNIFGMGSQISGYNIRVKDIGNLKSLSNELQDFLGYPYYVRTIFQVNQNIFTWLDLQKKPIPIVLGLIIFVAVFNIVGTLLMLVLERTNAIGILRSLGGNRKLIMKVFLLHAVFITAIGVATGNILALVISFLQDKFDIISLPGKVYFVTKVPIAINVDNYVLVSAVTIAIAIAASLLPAFIASKIKPISAIRFD